MTPSSTLTEPLIPLLPILNAFIHRHKNQHGASHWFRYVPILRRSLRSLVDLPVRASPATSNTGTNKKKTSAITSGDARITQHAKWLQEKVIPRCFLTFSQLAADNQHAPIGLLLLTLLAQVNTVLEAIVPPRPQPAPTTLAQAHAHSTKANQRDPTLSSLNAPMVLPDRGTVISRDLLDHSTKKSSKRGIPSASALRNFPAAATRSDTIAPATARGNLQSEGTSEVPEKKRKKAILEEDQVAQNHYKERDREPKLKTKKKKKKAGDAFSDLFGGL